MGHGDEVAVVDANFPAARSARRGGARLVELAGTTAPQVLHAVLQLLPLDDFGAEAAWTMQVVGDPDAIPEPVAEFTSVLEQDRQKPASTLERLEFYRRAEAAFAILRSGEQRKYGNILLRKGVVTSDAPQSLA